MLMKSLRKCITEKDGRWTIEHGDIEMMLDDESAQLMICILKGFNYRSLEEIQSMMFNNMYLMELDDLERDMNEFVSEGLAYRYSVNGQKYYVLNSDKKDEIEEILEST